MKNEQRKHIQNHFCMVLSKSGIIPVSRFDKEGKLLNNPETDDLKSIY